MFTEIINPYITVRNQVMNEHGEWVNSKTKTEKLFSKSANKKSIDLGEKEVIFEVWDKEIILESFVFTDLIGEGDAKIYPTLHLVEGATAAYADQLFYVIPINSSSSRVIQHSQNIKSGYCEQLEVVSYIKDETTNKEEFIVSLKKPIYLPQGARLAMNNQSTGEQSSTFSYYAVWREIGDGQY